MKREVFPSTLRGEIAAPGSKSIAQRLVAGALLSKGETIIRNYPNSEDCKAALSVAQALGAIVVQKGNELSIKGGFPSNFQAQIRNPKSEIFCGESGLASRLFTPIAALHDQMISVFGEGSLLTRPFSEFDKVLPALGATCETFQGRLPVRVQGPLKGGHATIDGALSSQFLTGLLMALPKASSDSHIIVSGLTSKPYVSMTMEVAALFGVEIKHENFEVFHIRAGQNYSAVTTTVPGDWSGAAFLIVAAAIAEDSRIVIRQLSKDITQADSQILEVLKLANVRHRWIEAGLEVEASDIHAFDFDANQCPDLMPPLAVLAAFGNGVSTIKGAKRLLHKESNRAKALQEEFAKANIRIVIREDDMMVYPGFSRSATLNAHNDHRIAMAAALLGLGHDKITVTGAHSIDKSYPEFFDHLQALGAKVV